MPTHPCASRKPSDRRLRELISDESADPEKRRLAQEVLDLRFSTALLLGDADEDTKKR